MKKLFKSKFILFTILVFTSCGPQKVNNNDQINSNSMEITELENKIAKLEGELAEQKSQSPKDSNNIESSEDIKALKQELLALIEELEERINIRLTNLDSELNTFKDKLGQIENNYVDLSKFSALEIKIQQDLDKKIKALKALLNNVPSDGRLNEIQTEIDELKKLQVSLKAEFKTYFKTAIEAWEKKLKTYIDSQDEEKDKKIRELITKEVQRLKLTDESLKNELESLEKDLASNNTGSNYSSDIENLKKLIEENKRLLDRVGELAKNSINENVYKDIFNKQFMPCLEGLKNNSYCYTLGSMITRLGGQFLDPKDFPKTKKGVIEYFTLSNVKISAVLDYPSSYLVPDNSNMSKLKKCHSDRDDLIPPYEYWPRGVVLALMLEKIENNINQQKSIGFISKNIKPVSSVTSWYRTFCYQNAINGRDIHNPAHKNKLSEGDHVFGAAFDLNLGDQKNKETFEYYRSFVLNHIWENDTFNIQYPLKSAKLTFTLGIGLGHGSHGKGKFHLGIGSEVDKGRKRDWGYKSNGVQYNDLLRYEK